LTRKGGEQGLTDYGDIAEGGEDLPQDSMTFRLDYREASSKKEDDQMWASSSSGAADWLYADEGS
jgi:hypothetical protein